MRTEGYILLLSFLLAFFGHSSSRAQDLIATPWQAGFSPVRTFDLNNGSLQEVFRKTGSRWSERAAEQGGVPIALPLPGGGEGNYHLWRSEQMEAELAMRYPGIGSYFGQAVNDSRQLVYLAQGPKGVKVLYFNEAGMYGRLEPIHPDLAAYRFSLRSDWGAAPDLSKACQTYSDEEETRFQEETPAEGRRGETKFFRYRLALACTGEYGSYHGDSKEEVLAAMNELLLQVNAIYERELSIHFDLVANNDLLIFLDPQTDPYDNFDMENLLESNKMVCNYSIGHANFDIGHVLATKFGGQAHIGSVCNFSRKAKAFSGLEKPEGYYMGAVLAHELGHQIGAQHTQGQDCNRNIGTAFEPGSGSTLMAYAGICAPNVQSLPDDYFHGNSLELIAKKAAQGIIFGCVPGVYTDNFPPVAQAGPDIYVPAGTPFELRGSGSDPDGDQLSYLWEQMDAAVVTDSTNLLGPIFRSLPPASSPVRAIGSVDPVWEALPTHARTVSFRLTVKDHHMGMGTSDYDDMKVFFVETAEPFRVLKPNNAQRWEMGSRQTVTWDVAGTDAAPFSCDSVSIALSADGGKSFPFLLAGALPNNGAAQVKMPLLTGTKFRIRVACSNGNFFDLSDRNFELFDPAPPPPPVDTIQTDTIVSNPPADTNTVVLDTTLTSSTDSTFVPDPDSTGIQITDTLTITTPDSTQLTAGDSTMTPVDTLTGPPSDSLWQTPVDTLGNVPADTLSAPPADTLAPPPLDTTVTSPPADTITTDPGTDATGEGSPVDTSFAEPPVDTLLMDPPLDTAGIDLPVDTLETPADTISTPPADSLTQSDADPVIPDGPDIGTPGDGLPTPGEHESERVDMHCRTCFPTITLAPNPSRGAFFLRLFVQKPDTGRFFIFNSQGKLLQERRLMLHSGTQEVAWDLTEHASGLYWVRVVIGDQQWSKALVVE